MGCEAVEKAEKADLPEADAAQQAAANVRFGGFALGDLEDKKEQGNLLEHYDVQADQPLGEGRFSIVYRCTRKETEQVFAVKTIFRCWLRSAAQTEIEARIMRAVDHPNIVRLIETFEDPQKVYHVQELCEGGELLDYVMDNAPFTERLAGVLFKQMVRALAYLHQNDIIHRDVKAENWLFTEAHRPEKSPLKLADFGAAKRLGQEDFATTKIGTPYYVAPEVLQGSYQHKADVWSLGILLHMFLGGSPPFAGADTEEVLTQVRIAKVNIERFGTFISEHAKLLLARILDRCVEKRPKAADLYEDPWLVKILGAKFAQADEEKGNRKFDGALDRFKGFGQANKLEKASMAAIASQLDRKAIADLEETFVAMDANGDGTLSLPELAQALKAAGVEMNKRDLQELLAKVDSNNTGVVEYSEFVAIMMDQARFAREDVCKKAFQAFDLDGSGFIERSELAKLLRSKDVNRKLGRTVASEAEITAICEELDSDADGRINFKEFMAMINRTGKG